MKNIYTYISVAVVMLVMMVASAFLADGRRCTCSCGGRLCYPDFRCDRYLGHCQSTAGRAG